MSPAEANYRQISNTIWNIANLLRGSWKAHEYQDVILPLTVLKRLDAALEPTKQKVLERFNDLDGKVTDLRILRRASGYDFYNVSPYTLKKLLEDPTHIARNLRSYINGFSENVQEIVKKFEFEKQMERLEGGNILYLVLQEFEKIDLHPDHVPNHVIGLAFEDLVRRFAEQSNETAGEHYTPRDVVRLMTALIFVEEEKELARPGIVKLLYDPACGTGGMLTVGKDYIESHFNKDAKIHLFGQELNSVTYAIAKADMLLKGENAENIKGGDKEHDNASTLSNDQHADKKFDYIICNPPYGVEWKKDKEAVEREHERGFSGRFGAGLPRISDGQLLFLQHIVSKFKPRGEGGSNAAVIFNGSPLFTGNAGSGESEIRRWVFENDFDKAIIALPEELFFNTGIGTYVWLLSNRKNPERKGKIQLIDARSFRHPLRRSLGEKRYEITQEDMEKIVSLHREFEENEFSKIFPITEFGYREITIQRPLRLRFDVDAEKLAPLKAQEDLIGRGLYQSVASLSGQSFNSRATFLEKLNSEVEKNGVKLTKKTLKIITDTLGVRDENAEMCLDGDGNPEPDKNLKDFEHVPLLQNVEEYFEKEIKPHVPDAWLDKSVCDEKDGKIGIVGYEVPFSRYFYKYEQLRDVEQINLDIKKAEGLIQESLKELDQHSATLKSAVLKGLNPKTKLKPSGIEWLEDIPHTWKVKPFRTLFKEKTILNRGGLEKNVLSLSYGKIVNRNLESNLGLLPESFDTYQIVDPNWIVFRLTDLQNDHKSLRTGLVTERGIITSAYLAVEPTLEIHPEYAAFLLRAYDLLKVFYSMGGGVRQSIGYAELKWLPIILPPIEEQTEIVRFLAAQVQETERVIKTIDSQIEALKEYRSALVYATVTGKIKVNHG